MGNLLNLVSRMTKVAKPRLDWEQRYGGVLCVGIVDSIPIAGISGPWPDGKFSLTWWAGGNGDETPSLEFHPSREMARQRVEAAVAERARAA